MVIIRVNWTDWNGEDHSTDVTSDMCVALGTIYTEEEDLFSIAIKYVKRRHTEWTGINSVELIAK